MAIKRPFKAYNVIICIESVIHTTRRVKRVYFTWVAQNSHHLRLCSYYTRQSTRKALGKMCSHTSNIVPERLVERAPIFTSTSLDCSPRSQFCYGLRNNCSHCIKVWHIAYPICDASFSGSSQNSFALLQK